MSLRPCLERFLHDCFEIIAFLTGLYRWSKGLQRIENNLQVAVGLDHHHHYHHHLSHLLQAANYSDFIYFRCCRDGKHAQFKVYLLELRASIHLDS